MTGWTRGNTTLHSSLLPRDSSASFSPTSGFGRRQRPTEGPRSCFSKRSWTSQHDVEMPHECACSTATVSETLRVVCLCHLCLTAFSPFSFPDTGKPGRFDTRSEIRTFLGHSYVLWTHLGPDTIFTIILDLFMPLFRHLSNVPMMANPLKKFQIHFITNVTNCNKCSPLKLCGIKLK